jgi:hypothetical protein
MKQNVGATDKIIRILLAIVFAALYITNVVTGTLGIVLLVVAVVFAATALVGFCPLYALFGLNTCPVKKTRS